MISENDYAEETDDEEDSDSYLDTNEDDENVIDAAEEETSSIADDNMLEQASVSGKESMADFRNIYHSAQCIKMGIK